MLLEGSLRKFPVKSSGTALLFFLALFEMKGEPLKTQTWDDFSKTDSWSIHYRRNSFGSISASQNELPARTESGSYLKISYSGEKGSGFRLKKTPPVFLEGCTFQLSIDIFGYGDFMEFYADFRDTRNQFHRISAGIIKHRGWKTIQIPLSGIRARRIQLNRGLDGIHLEGFYIKNSITEGKLHFLLDELISVSGPCTRETKKSPLK